MACASARSGEETSTSSHNRPASSRVLATASSTSSISLHPLPVVNVFRPDEPAPCLPVDAALQNAPNRVGDYFGVPAVFDTDEPVSH